MVSVTETIKNPRHFKTCISLFLHGWKSDIMFFSSTRRRAVNNSQHHAALRACGCLFWLVLREKYIFKKDRQLCKECLTCCAWRAAIVHLKRFRRPWPSAAYIKADCWNPAGQHASARCCCHGDDHAAHHSDSSRSAAAYAQTDERYSLSSLESTENLKLNYNTAQTDWSGICGFLQSDHSLLCCHRNTPGA